MLSSEGHKRAQGWLGWLMIGALRVYQLSLSPVFYALGVRCRHLPTCSAYGMDAVRAQGAWRGGWLTFGRVCRCRPGGTHGHDPAPVHRNEAPWWAVWRFRSRPCINEMNSLPPADRADDKE
jgi:putative membrane protein insertion efficiency factor